MPTDYLTLLPLTAAERDKLAQLAAPDAATMLGMVEAAPEDFRSFFGDYETDRLIGALIKLVTPAQRRQLKKSAPRFPIFGAVQGRRAPDLPPPGFDIERRNSLFESLEALRKIPKPDAAERVRIEHLERELNEMLDG